MDGLGARIGYGQNISECNCQLEILRAVRDLGTVSWEAPELNKAFLAAGGILVDAAFSLDVTRLPFAGTPTLVLIKRNGTAIKTWQGRLDPTSENTVLHLVATRE
jgi:hypothetical protein